ncbi:MAG: hypothetical protein J5965_28035 [Aeriscardovia sp.]|nr:hypothetical protein [Aeriscardovia sp.]
MKLKGFNILVRLLIMLNLIGDKNMVKYSFKLANDEILDYSYILDDFDHVFNSEFKKIEKFNTDVFENIYFKGKTYYGVFSPGFEKHFYIISESEKIFELLESKKVIFYNPDDNINQLNYFELLNNSDMLYLFKKYESKRLDLDSYEDGFTKYFILSDGRCCLVIDRNHGQLFAGKDDLITYEKMVYNSKFGVVVEDKTE